MEIRQQYLQRYLHDIAIDQLVADYQAKGYQVTKEEKIGKYQADLVAKREGEVIVVEVKTGRMTAQKRRELTEIGDYVRTQKNYKFLVVIATPPKPKKIDVPNLDQLLYDYLVDHLPNQLDQLSSNTRITGVLDAVVNELTVSDDGSIVAKGSAIVEVELNYGSKDDQTQTGDSFPFDFRIILKYNLSQELFLDEAENIDFDTSSFYE